MNATSFRSLAALSLALAWAASATGASDAPADPRESNAWFAAGRAAVARAQPMTGAAPPAKNVILFVGDGMGVATVTAARILEGQRRGELGEGNLLAFERFPHLALSKTYSSNAQVPDSAATMTAMVSGVKTKSGSLGVSEEIVHGDFRSVEKTRVGTLLEEAETRGLATGVVTTTSVTHATPAACYAHAAFRFWEDDSRLPEEAREAGFPDIARQLVEFDFGDGLEVALGGGRQHFRPKGAADPEHGDKSGGRLDGRDLTQEWLSRREGAVYVWNREQFDAIDLEDTRYLLGLFEPQDMNWEADRAADPAGEPALAEMTSLAIDLLSRNPKGFFLMVEGGRIDHGHHASNAYRALGDTIALSDAVRVALTKTRPEETLIVVTADHSHTLTIAGYPKRGNPILGKVVAVNTFTDGEEEISKDALGKPYTTLGYANGPGYTGASDSQPEGAHSFGHRPCTSWFPFRCGYEGIAKGRPDLGEVDTEASSYLQESVVPMASESHAGEDVPIYATGPRAGLFHGVKEQNYIYHAIAEALGWTHAGKPLD